MATKLGCLQVSRRRHKFRKLSSYQVARQLTGVEPEVGLLTVSGIHEPACRSTATLCLYVMRCGPVSGSHCRCLHDSMG